MKRTMTKKGDNNTKFFQRMETTHNIFNTIDRMIVNGEETREPTVIKEDIIDFYKKNCT